MLEYQMVIPYAPFPIESRQVLNNGALFKTEKAFGKLNHQYIFILTNNK